MGCPPLFPVGDGDGFCVVLAGALESVLPVGVGLVLVDDSTAGVEEVGAGVWSDTVDGTSDGDGCADVGSPPPLLVGYHVGTKKNKHFHCVEYPSHTHTSIEIVGVGVALLSGGLLLLPLCAGGSLHVALIRRWL